VAESSSNSPADTTVNKNAEDNKENNNSNDDTDNFDTPTASSAKRSGGAAAAAKESNQDEQVEEADSKDKQARDLAHGLLRTLSKSSKSNLFKKFLAGCVNSKLKEGLRSAKGAKPPAKKSENVDEDDDDVEDLLDDAELDEDSEEDETEDEDEDDDDDDDDEDEDEDGEEAEDAQGGEEEEEDEDEEEDYDSAAGYGQESRPGFDSGCTAVVALLANNKDLYVANAGDSRCIVCREGKAIDMSVDHKPEDDIERQRIFKGNVTC
jgi:protein phosphatase 1G